jgi:hypothetical protein
VRPPPNHAIAVAKPLAATPRRKPRREPWSAVDAVDFAKDSWTLASALDRSGSEFDT